MAGSMRWRDRDLRSWRGLAQKSQMVEKHIETVPKWADRSIRDLFPGNFGAGMYLKTVDPLW